MAKRWIDADRKTLQSLLEEGVELNLLKEHLPNRTHDALHRESQKYGYGVKTVDGVRVLYYGKKTRNRKKKAEDISVTKTVTKTIVGKPRVAGTTQEPTTSKQTTENVTDSIIAENYEDSAQSTIFNIYPELDKLLNNSRYPLLQTLSITLKCGSSVSVSKGST